MASLNQLGEGDNEMAMGKSSDRRNPPKIYWILQENQVSPFMVDFLKLTNESLNDAHLEFKILLQDKGALKIADPLRPSTFSIRFHEKNRSLQSLIRKRDALGQISYSSGLPLWRVLLLDDLGAETIAEPILDLSLDESVKCIVVQIPSVVGSTQTTERLFHALTLLAQNRKIPIIGCEFFPLNTRWTLAPSLLDGIITTRESSYDYLTTCCGDMPSHIRLLPSYEACFFFLDCPPFWRNGLGIAYKYANLFGIPMDRTILYIPHNVSMIYEYQKILQHLTAIGKSIHIMFAIGIDQTRGTYTHQEIIEKVCKNELEHFGSFSFHNLNKVEEMTMADCVLTATTCGSSCFSSTYGIPTIIMDEELPVGSYGSEKIVNTLSGMKTEIERIVDRHGKTTGFTRIISEILAWRKIKS